MKSYRPLRLAGLIQEELGKIIQKNVDFPADSLVTVSQVNVSPDLERAKIYISVIPTDLSEEVLKILLKLAGRLQFILNRKLNIKPMPKIHFEIDLGPANAAEVEKLLLKK